MYRIIGDDGREYGPVPAEQVRQWIAEGRANAVTRALAEGAADWKPLALFPEFAPLLNSGSGGASRGDAPVAAPPAFGASASASSPMPLPTPASLAGTQPVRQNNPFAVAGLALAILSLCCCCCCYGLPFNLAGLVCSLIGLLQIRGQPDRYYGQGIAIAGLVLSILSLLGGLGLFLFALASGQGGEFWREMQRL